MRIVASEPRVRAIESGEFSAVRLRNPGMSWTLSVAYRREQSTSRAVAALRDVIRAEVNRLLASGAWRSEPPPRERRQAAG